MYSKTNKLLSIFMWLLPLSFFTYQFILRLWPSLTMNSIMQQFGIEAAGFGILASFYYYGYALMQIPIAVLIEKYGVRIVLFACAVLSGLATIAFTTTDSWLVACLSRLLVGVGSAAGFLGVSKVISEWFPKEKYAKMVGLSFTIGLMGAIYGGKPISLLIDTYSWQEVALTLALVAITIGVTAFVFLKAPKNSDGTKQENQVTLVNFKKLISSKTIWLVGISNLLMVGSLEGFADVWGVQFLMTAYEMEKSDAAELVSFIFIGMLFGGPLLALLSTKIGNYNVIGFCGLGMAFAFFVMIFNQNLSWFALAAILFSVGVMCCYQVLIFAVGSDLVAPALLGVTVAFLNCMNMLGGSFFHSLIGMLMDSFWTELVSEEGLRVYTLDSYEAALLLIPISSIIGGITVLMVGRKKVELAAEMA